MVLSSILSSVARLRVRPNSFHATRILVWLGSLAMLPMAIGRANDSIQKLTPYADGQNDATAAIQALVDSKPGCVEFPPGTFLISKTITIPLADTGYIAIEGSPATKLSMSGEGPVFLFQGSHFKSADPAGFSQGVWDRQRMPSVTGIAIEGTHEHADGIAAAGTMQLTVSRVHLRNLRHGIHLLQNNRNVLIESCHIYENHGIGIFYDDVNLHQSNIVGCHISYCDQGGIVSRQGNVRNIHITGCDLESNMAPDQPPTANVFIDSRNSQYGTAEVAITGCTIQHNDTSPKSANIRIIGRTMAAGQRQYQREGHVTITGNVLSDVATNIWLESCRGVTIVGNTCWMGFEHNLLITECAHVVVGPNNFDRNPRYDYGHSLEAKNRLVFRNCQDCTLTGLHIAHVWEEPALSLEQCDRFNVSGLTVLDCDIGLRLLQVTRSRFSNCMIRDDRTEKNSGKKTDKNSVPLVSIDSTDNQWDASLGLPSDQK